MTIESEVLMNEKEKDQVAERFRIVISGTERDSGIVEKLEQSGHEVVFKEAGEELADATVNFTFRHLQPGMDYAKQHGFDVVLGIDRSLNKISVAVRKSAKENFMFLSVHQLASLLTDHWTNDEDEKGFISLKSIHISDMLDTILHRKGKQGTSEILMPGELTESATALLNSSDVERVVGFTENQEIYDSRQSFDEIVENIVVLEQQLKAENKTLFDELIRLYSEYGFYKEKAFVEELVSDVQKSHIEETMRGIRRNPRILNEYFPIKAIVDYRLGRTKNLMTGKVSNLDHPKKDILRLELSNGISVSFVPSETKMSYFFSAVGRLSEKELYAEESRHMDQRIIKLMQVINHL